MLDPTSPEIRLGHLRAASYERPLTPGCDEQLGDGALAEAEALAEAGELLRTPAGLTWRGSHSPAGRIGLRDDSMEGRIAVVDHTTGAVLGELEVARALWTTHEGAIYLHRGEPYLVESLDLEGRIALCAPFEGGYYTQPRRETETRILSRMHSAPTCGRASS